MANDTPLISIVIPVYNAAGYLPRCLDSVTAQTLTDFEALVVNDCSTDGSAAIAREYGLRDPRIRLIDKPRNEGTMLARRSGYEAARGEFVVFCDGDDIMPPDALERLHALTADGDDIVLAGVRMISPDGEIKLKPRIRADVRTRDDIYEALLRQRITWYMCAAIFRRSLFDNNLETFPGQCVNEDYMMLLQLLLLTDRVKFVNEYVYDYLLQPGSMTQGAPSVDKLHQELRANRWSCDFLCRRGIQPDLARWLYIRRVVKCLPRGYTRRQIFDSGLLDEKLFTIANINRYVGPKYVFKYLYWSAAGWLRGNRTKQ